MRTTRAVLAALRQANPGTSISEDRVRHALRRGDVEAPEAFAGRLAWDDRGVEALARALGLRVPKEYTGVRDTEIGTTK